MDAYFLDRHARYYHRLSIGLDGLGFAQGTRRNLQFEPDSPASDPGEFPLCFHPIAIRSLYSEHLLRCRNDHRDRAPLPFHGGIRFRPSALSRARDDIPDYFFDVSCFVAGDHRSSIHSRAEDGNGEQLPRTDCTGDFQRLWHIPVAPILSRDTAGPARSRDYRRGQLLGNLLEYHASLEPAHFIGFGRLLFSGQLECISLAVNDYHQPGSLARPAGHSQFPGTVFFSLELYYGGLGRRGDADPGPLLRLPTPVGRIDQDHGYQMTLSN